MGKGITPTRQRGAAFRQPCRKHTHYRIDINTFPPSIPEASWRLKIHGLIARPLVWMLADLRARPAMHQFITLSCISNTLGGDLIGTTRWSRVSLQQLLPELGFQPNATHLRIHSADGFYEVVALDTIRGDGRVMLADAWDGLPLREKHGFPLRMYIPDRYGMTQMDRIHRGDRSLGTRVLGGAQLGPRSAPESDFRNRCRRDEYDDCRADTGDACAHWKHRPRWHPRHIESQAPCGQWRMDAGGTAHALIRPALGDVAIRLAHAKGQAHLHGALLRGMARRRSHRKLRRTRVAPPGSTRARSCSERPG